MPEHIRGRNRPMECLFERAIKNMGFRLIHDGSKESRDVKWLSAPTFFTRTYRSYVDGQPVNTFIRFTYDLRTGDADFTVSSKDLDTFEQAVEESNKRLIAKQPESVKEL